MLPLDEPAKEMLPALAPLTKVVRVGALRRQG